MKFRKRRESAETQEMKVAWMTTLVGNQAIVPAHIPGERGVRSLKLDLVDSSCLRFALEGGTQFAISQEALHDLLDAYNQTQSRIDGSR